MIKRLPLSIIIPTKDREKLLLKSLKFLDKNFFFCNEVIIVDSSKKKLNQKKLSTSYKRLNIRYYGSKPSTSKQRNLGLKNARKKMNLSCFWMMILNLTIIHLKKCIPLSIKRAPVLLVLDSTQSQILDIKKIY